MTGDTAYAGSIRVYYTFAGTQRNTVVDTKAPSHTFLVDKGSNIRVFMYGENGYGFKVTTMNGAWKEINVNCWGLDNTNANSSLTVKWKR